MLNLNSDDGGIPHREANIRVDAKLALNRENHEESKVLFLADPFRFMACSFGLGIG